MAVDPALIALTEEIEDGQPWPRPRCSTCSAGHISYRDPERFESQRSVDSHKHPAFDVEWIYGSFLIQGQCENPGCRQSGHAAGTYRVGDAKLSAPVSLDYEAGLPYSAFYRVAQLYPAPVLLQIPEGAPAGVGAGAARAGSVLFADPGLAATALRGTVEEFLTDQGVSGRTPSGGFRALDKRIAEWLSADIAARKHAADLLSAVRWLGNAGTHAGESALTLLDVLDGASVLEEVFHGLYTTPGIHARARRLTAAYERKKPLAGA